jgi:SAM-dependent methyltransferase
MARTLKAMWREPKKPEGWVGDYKYIPKVLDIAANDGCLLREFQRNGFGVVGVEPAKNLASSDSVVGRAIDGELIPMYNEFWSDDLAQNIVSGGNKFDFVVATNVLAHVDDLDDFLIGVERVLMDRGVFVVEVPYLPRLIENNAFDTIYHEHLSYFLLYPLRMKFEQHGLTIFKVEQYPIHGGSMRIYAGKGNCITDPSVFSMERTEAEDGYYGINKYKDFKRAVEMVKTILKETMASIKNSGNSVAAFGASAKGSTLLNYCGIIGNDLEYIVDDTEYKQGRWVAGIGVQVVPFIKLYEKAPDYILITPWNFKDEIMLKTKYVGAKYIIPIPQVEIL